MCKQWAILVLAAAVLAGCQSRTDRPRQLTVSVAEESLLSIDELTSLYEQGVAAFRSGDLRTAEPLLRQAASQDYVAAQLAIAELLVAQGRFEPAADWLRRAGDLGDPSAQLALAQLLRRGQGVPRDDEAATSLLERAADQNREARFQLAVAKYQGLGTPRDLPSAARIFEALAQEGLAAAQFNFGVMHRDGQVPSPSRTEALAWMKVAETRTAAGSSRDGFATQVAALRRELSPSEVEEADRLAAEHLRQSAQRGTEAAAPDESGAPARRPSWSGSARAGLQYQTDVDRRGDDPSRVADRLGLAVVAELQLNGRLPLNRAATAAWRAEGGLFALEPTSKDGISIQSLAAATGPEWRPGRRPLVLWPYVRASLTGVEGERYSDSLGFGLVTTAVVSKRDLLILRASLEDESYRVTPRFRRNAELDGEQIELAARLLRTFGRNIVVGLSAGYNDKDALRPWRAYDGIELGASISAGLKGGLGNFIKRISAVGAYEERNYKAADPLLAPRRVRDDEIYEVRVTGEVPLGANSSMLISVGGTAISSPIPVYRINYLESSVSLVRRF